MAVKSPDEYPRPWKKYRVRYLGGIFEYDDIEAPNKTYAREFFKGFHQPWHRILRIDELKEDIK